MSTGIWPHPIQLLLFGLDEMLSGGGINHVWNAAFYSSRLAGQHTQLVLSLTIKFLSSAFSKLCFCMQEKGRWHTGQWMASIYEVLDGPLNAHFLQVCNFEITCKKLIAHITSWDCSILCSLRTKLIMKIDFWFWGCRIWNVDWIIGLMDFNLALKEHFSQQGFLLETHVAFQDDLLNTCSKNWKFA